MNSLHAALSRKTATKSRDWWDKAPVVISAFSSIVLAATGLYISASFQKAQLLITKENNDAQLKIAKEKNASDLRLQELKSATDLMEPLLSSDDRKRQIAIVMLPHSISDQTMTRQILFIATHDKSPEVRVTALTQMAQASHPSVAAQLQEFAVDPSRPANERALASNGAVSVSLRATAPVDSVIYFASQPGRLAYESAELNGGVFTFTLLKGLAGEAVQHGKFVTSEDLGHYLLTQMPVIADKVLGEPSYPFVENTTTRNETIIPVEEGKRESALVVGVENYHDSSIPIIRFANSDASKVGELLSRAGVKVSLLRDPTRTTFLETLRSVLSQLGAGDKFLFYYSGHGVMVDGVNLFLMSDSVTSNPALVKASAVTASEVKTLINQTDLALSAWFLDICQVAPYPESR